MVRSRDPERIFMASRQWLHDLTSVAPSSTFLSNMTAALLPNGKAVIMPLWLASDTALMERLVPHQTRWIDGRLLRLGLRDNQVKVYLTTNERSGIVSGVILDHGYLTLDLTTPGRRMLQMLRQGLGTDREGSLDTAMLLAAPDIRWVTVNTENLGNACTTAAALIADVQVPDLP